MHLSTKYFIHFPDKSPSIVRTESAVRNVLAAMEVDRVVRVTWSRGIDGTMHVIERQELTFA